MSNFQKTYLPTGDILFKVYWLEMGKGRSINKMCGWCKLHGYENPDTGKPPTWMAVWFRMYRWMIRPENQEEAFQIFSEAEKNDNNRIHFSYEGETRQHFKMWLKSQARTSLSSGRRRIAYKKIVDGLDV
jgi:hypothetical protein